MFKSCRSLVGVLHLPLILRNIAPPKILSVVSFCPTPAPQEGCCLAFAVGVPLLGKHQRRHVHRCFALAAQILQDLESPLARLRAQLHLEVIRVDFPASCVSRKTDLRGMLGNRSNHARADRLYSLQAGVVPCCRVPRMSVSTRDVGLSRTRDTAGLPSPPMVYSRPT